MLVSLLSQHPLLVPDNWRKGAAGLALSASLAALAISLAQLPALAGKGLSPLTLAIAIGLLAGNLGLSRADRWMMSGYDLARGPLLRLAIVLYGFRVSGADLLELGVAGIAMAICVVVAIPLIAWPIGRRLLGLDAETTLLIASGSAVCGAAAVIAAEAVLRAPPHKTSVAVATVVVFGSLSMLIYPLLYPFLGLTAEQYGILIGASVHEVAQVVVASSSIGPDAAQLAVIEKMLRVMLLAPFLVMMGLWLRQLGSSTTDGQRTPVTIPWFALGFVAVCLLHPLLQLEPEHLSSINHGVDILLACAMAALGLRTRVSALRQAGMAPMLLAAILFVVLSLGGWGLSRLLFTLF